MASAAAKSRQSSKGRRRGDAPRNLWTSRAGDVAFGLEEFKLTLSRKARKLGPVPIDTLVEHLDWGREGAILTGEMNMRRPFGHDFPVSGLIARGDELVVSYRTTWRRGQWREVFRIGVYKAPTFDVGDGQIVVALRSTTKPVTQSRVNWKFRKDKRHPRGWRAHTGVREACRRFGVKVGKLAQGKHWTEKLEDKSASVLDIAIRFYENERKATGNRFVLDLSRGRLDVVPLRHPKYMHTLGPAIMAATTTESLTNFATTLIVTGHVKVGKKRKKVTVRVTDKARVRKYGEIVKTVKKNGLASKASLKRWGQRELARIHKPLKAITFTHPGLPWLDRGDALKLVIDETDLIVTCYVKAVRHTLAAGSYEMEVTVGFTDPWLDTKQKKVDQKKAAAKQSHGRERGDTHPPEPKRNRRRGDD